MLGDDSKRVGKWEGMEAGWIAVGHAHASVSMAPGDVDVVACDPRTIIAFPTYKVGGAPDQRRWATRPAVRRGGWELGASARLSWSGLSMG